MNNPLKKRFPRELKKEFGKNLVLFLFLTGVIGIVSGQLVASKSMKSAYDESFEKYNIEDGNFELLSPADAALLQDIEKENTKIYENLYIEEETDDIDSTLRIYMDRETIDKVCIMKGELPDTNNEIALDRMYADNNELYIGDLISLGGKKYEITGFIALSDYSALFQKTSDMMFDATRFGVAIVTDETFSALRDVSIHYNYSWKYEDRPQNDADKKERSDVFLSVLMEKAQLHNNVVVNYIPEYINQAILFTGDDLGADYVLMTVFLYIVVVIISFVFAITTSNTISKEANVIGTLRASGYTRGEIVRHYMTIPICVMFVAAICGNLLGYTFFKNVMVDMYYASYSLPTYVTLWNADAFIKTTLVPITIMIVIIATVLIEKMHIPPLQFIRREIKRNPRKKAFKLNSRIKIMHRYKIRVLFQNIPNYITVFFGIFFANIILLFGICLVPVMDHYEDEIINNKICNYQYILKAPVLTTIEGAEKYNFKSLKTADDKRKSEDVSCYGIIDESKYISAVLDIQDIFISDAYAKKFEISVGDIVTVKEAFADKKYTFTVGGNL